VGTATAANVDLGFGIAVAALVRQPAENFGAVAFFEQRPVVAAAGSLRQHIDRSIEPDGNRSLVQKLASSRVHERPATRGDYPDFTLDQPGNQAPFAIAEIMLAITFEQVGRAGTRCLLNLDVAVDERKVKPPGKPTSNRRFARSHQADEHDWSVEKFGQLVHFVVKSLWAGLYIGPPGRAKAFLQSRSQSGATMPRGLIFLVLFVIILIGGIVLLSRSADEVPVKVIETDVTSNAAAN